MNYRTYKLLSPYKGYSILRTHTEFGNEYAAHKSNKLEKYYIDYLYDNEGYEVSPQLFANSLKEIKKRIEENIKAEIFISKANIILNGVR